jgi:hypothetical protein
MEREHPRSALRVSCSDGCFYQWPGTLRARVFGLPVASDSGHAVDVGELVRFLAGLPWCPLAYSSPELCWEEVDEQTLKVTRVLGPTPVSVDLTIDAMGPVLGAHATRPGKIGKRSFVADWIGEFGPYEEIAGMRIPTTAEVHWLLPEGKLTYFKGEVSPRKSSPELTAPALPGPSSRLTSSRRRCLDRAKADATRRQG